MGLKAGDTYCFTFSTTNAAGTLTNADSLPTATAYHNGAVDGSFTLTVTHVSTSIYKIVGTVPSGYAENDQLDVFVACTVASQPASGFVDSRLIDGAVAGVSKTEALRRIGATTAGPVTGGGTSNEQFADFAGNPCVQMDPVDISGNRTPTYH